MDLKQRGKHWRLFGAGKTPPAEVETLLNKLGLPDKGRKLVRDAYAQAPVRFREKSGVSTLVDFSSAKTGYRWRFESRGHEYSQALQYELDPDVISYLHQPLQLSVKVFDIDGKPASRKVVYPDFLVFRRNSIDIEEVRSEEAMEKRILTDRSYICDANGNYQNPSIDDALQGTGIPYTIETQIPSVLSSNAGFLLAYLRQPEKAKDSSAIQRLKDLFGEVEALSWNELIDQHKFNADDLGYAVAHRMVFVDLLRVPLHDHDNVVVYRDEMTMNLAVLEQQAPSIFRAEPFPVMNPIFAANTRFLIGQDCYQLIDADDHTALLRRQDGAVANQSVVRLLRRFQDREIDVDPPPLAAVSRMQSARAISEHDLLEGVKKRELLTRTPEQLSERTRARYKAKCRHSSTALEAAIFLSPQNHLKGNRSLRLSSETLALAEQTIDVFYNSPDAPSRAAAYLHYVAGCKEEEVEPMGRTAFLRRCKEKESVFLRKGRRVAYQDEPQAPHLGAILPKNGTHPHAIVHIDMTVADLLLKRSEFEAVGKPGLALAVDAFTKQYRAHTLYVGGTSTEIVMLLIRDYVRRHHRLPEQFVVDGGSDLNAEFVQKTLRIFGVSLTHRPAAKARAGGPVEGGFKYLNQTFLHQSTGNTKIMKNVRGVTPAVNPINRAFATLAELDAKIEDHLYTGHNADIDSELGCSPDELEAAALKYTGARRHLEVQYNEDFMFLTSLPPKRGDSRRHDAQRGVYVNYRYYWCQALRRVRKNDTVEIRVEPWDTNRIYVRLGNTVHVARCHNSGGLQIPTTRLFQLVVRETRRGNKALKRQEVSSPEFASAMANVWLRPEIRKQATGDDELVNLLISKKLVEVGVTNEQVEDALHSVEDVKDNSAQVREPAEAVIAKHRAREYASDPVERNSPEKQQPVQGSAGNPLLESFI